MERERIAAVVRDRVMATPLPTAPHVGAWTMIANTGAVFRATDDSAPRLAAAYLPRYSGARDLQPPEEFLEPALNPPYCRDRQYSCATAPTFSPYGPGPTPRQEATSGAMHVQCHRCGGFGHISRNCATVPGKPVTVGAATAGTYGSAHQVATTAGGKEPLMDVRIGSSTFKALLDTGSSVIFFGPQAAAAARASGTKPKADVRVLRLASGWRQSTMSLKCQIEWAARCRRQQFLCVPDLCRDVVLGRDFLTVSGISLQVPLGDETVGTEPQRMGLFVKVVKNSQRQWMILKTVCAAFLLRAMPVCVPVCRRRLRLAM
ncbi:hypothetical protein MRX96_023339 [Rhipicephalus microplus]